MTSRMFKACLASTTALALLAAACSSDDSDDAAVDNAAADEAVQDDAEGSAEAEIEVDAAALQAQLDDWRAEAETFGATLSLRVPGHDDMHLASGIDDRDPDTPMPIDGTYGVYSITKTFVAAATLRLVDDGRLSLDDTVEPWLPELPAADQTTVEMLLAHRTGLGTWCGTNATPTAQDACVATIGADLTRSYVPEEVLALHLGEPALASPGEEGLYTNTNYTALGLLLERQLDQDLGDIIADQFIEPLALDDTVFSDGTTRGTRHGWFSPDGDPDRPIDTLDIPAQAIDTTLWGAGNMISSSADLLTWGNALYSGEVLGDATTDEMLDMRGPVHLPNNPWYGLGAGGYCRATAACPADEVELVGHPGRGPGSTTLLVHHRDSGVTMAINTNVDVGTDGANLVELAQGALDALGIEAGRQAN